MVIIMDVNKKINKPVKREVSLESKKEDMQPVTLSLNKEIYPQFKSEMKKRNLMVSGVFNSFMKNVLEIKDTGGEVVFGIKKQEDEN